MKIIDFIPYYRPHIGGLEKFSEELHQHLVSSGNTVVVFSPNLPISTEYEQAPSLKILRYPAFEIIPNYPLPKFWKKKFWQQLRFLAQENGDIVFSTSRFFFQSVIAHFWAKYHHKKRIHIEHGSDHVTSTPLVTLLAYIYDCTFGRFVLKHADQIITASTSAARFVQKMTGISPPVIYRGMPFEEIAALPANTSFRDAYPGKKTVIYIGRLIYGKGVAVLLEAVARMKRDDFILLIVGDGPEKNNLLAQTKRLGITSRVKFIGSKTFNETMSILKASDVFVNPSFNEGLPTSVLEAAACSIAIIATDVGGTTEIVKNHESALIVPPNDTEALLLALEQILSDKTLRQKLVQTALNQVSQKFRWEATIAAYQKAISSLTL